MNLNKIDKQIAENLSDIAFLIRKANWEDIPITERQELLELSKKLNYLLTDCY